MIFIRSVFILLVTALLFNCSEYPEDTEVLRLNDNALRSGVTPDNSPVSIGPVNATANSIINLMADDAMLEKARISWYVNDRIDSNTKGPRFVSKRLKKGDIVHAALVNDKGKFYSNRITLKNSPPVISRARLLPPLPVASSVLKAEADAYDHDRDIVSFRYKWTVNGKTVSENPYLEYEFRRGDSISAEVAPFDSESSGKGVTLRCTISNSLPVIDENQPLIDGRTYKYQIRANDPDGDTLIYTLEEGPEGMTVNADGMLKWEVPSDIKKEYGIKVSVSDNQGGKILVPFTARIFFKEEK